MKSSSIVSRACINFEFGCLSCIDAMIIWQLDSLLSVDMEGTLIFVIRGDARPPRC